MLTREARASFHSAVALLIAAATTMADRQQEIQGIAQRHLVSQAPIRKELIHPGSKLEIEDRYTQKSDPTIPDGGVHLSEIDESPIVFPGNRPRKELQLSLESSMEQSAVIDEAREPSTSDWDSPTPLAGTTPAPGDPLAPPEPERIVTELFPRDSNDPDDETPVREAAPMTPSFPFWGAVANLCSATLGAGVLALPYALAQAGIVASLIMLVVSALATLVSIRLLVLACHVYECYSYETLVQSLFGTRWRRLVDACLVLFCGGCAVAYLIAIGDILEELLHHRELGMILAWSLVLVPLSCLPKMTHLQASSAMGMASIGALVFAAAMHWLMGLGESVEPDVTPNSTDTGYFGLGDDEENSASLWEQTVPSILWPMQGWVSVLTACPIVLFAFSCQVNVCAIFHELPEQEDKLWFMRRVTWCAVGICALLYTSIASVSVADFGRAIVHPNILNNYELEGFMVLAAASMAIAVMLAFPLNIFPARVTVRSWFPIQQLEDGPNETLTAALLEDRPDAPQSARRRNEPVREIVAIDWWTADTRQHLIVTAVLTVGTLLLALWIPDISTVFGLLGGTTTSVLGFGVPGALGLQLKKDAPEQVSTLLWIGSWCLLVGGTVVGVVTTAVTLYDDIFG